MRRTDRQRDAAFALEVLRKAPCATLSLVTPQGEAYGIPISPAVTEKGIYFHCATEGKKLDCIRAHPQVCLSAASKMRTLPEEYSVAYDSAVVFGRAEIVEDEAERIEALRAICQRYVPRHMDRFDSILTENLSCTCVVRIIPEEITGKQRAI